MRLTKHTDIALRVMMHLAVERETHTTVRYVARRYNVSRNHLVKVVHELVNLGYLSSVQGRGGGERRHIRA